MRSEIKNPKNDLRNYYKVFLELGIVVTLLIFIVATKIEFVGGKSDFIQSEEQEVTKMEEVIQTEQKERMPVPPRPQVPVEVPNDEIIEEQEINIDAEMRIDEPLEMPPPPEEAEDDEEEEDFFVAVEQMPKLKGSLAELQKKINYPEKAKKAGIEGRVIVQFIINEEGNIEDPKVIRSIGGGCDEEAVRVTKMAKFEPGRQRGEPVRVRYSLPFMFDLR